MSSPSPPPFCWSIVSIALAVVLVATVALQVVNSSRQARTHEWLRVENELLDQEARGLRQELEAERLQSAALARLLRPAAPDASIVNSAPAPAETP